MQYQFIFTLPPSGVRKIGYSNSDVNDIDPVGGKFAPWNQHAASIKKISACVASAFADMMQRQNPDFSAEKNHQQAIVSGVHVEYKGVPTGTLHDLKIFHKMEQELLESEYLSGISGNALFRVAIKSPGGDWFYVSEEPIEVSWSIPGTLFLFRTTTMKRRREQDAPQTTNRFAPPSPSNKEARKNK